MTESRISGGMTAFVLMPFDDSLEWVFRDVIAPTLAANGYLAVRADGVLDQQNILRDIVQGIASSDIVIVDLTGLNPNVMYELGLAHGLRKPTLVLTQDISSAPFDLRAYRMLPYTAHYQDVMKLIQELTSVLEVHREGKVAFGSPITDFAPEALPAPAILRTFALGAEAEEGAVEEQPAETLGTLDFVQEFLDAMDMVTTWSEHVTEVTGDFTRNMQERSERSNAIVGNDRDAMKKRRLIAQSAARIISEWAKELGAGLPLLNGTWARLEDTTDGFLATVEIQTVEEREAATNLIETFKDLERKMDVTIESIEGAKQSTSNLEGIERSLSAAVKNGQRALNQVVDSLVVGKSYVARVVTVLEDRLNAPAILEDGLS